MSNVAILVGPDFEDSELTVPRDLLKEQGHDVTLLGRKAGETLEGKTEHTKITVDAHVRDHAASEFDALVIPGGFGPDQLRIDEDVVGFVREFAETGRPLAAVCHGPQLLIEAGVVGGKRMTSWPSVRTDLINAGAKWVDEEVVTDGSFITSRKPDDLEAFTQTLLQRLD